MLDLFLVPSFYLSFFLVLLPGPPSILNPSSIDSSSIASSITYHAEFTPLFSPHEFSLPKAFYAAAQSVRDSLIINWNATYDHYEKMNVKQAYYLSMEFLQVYHLFILYGFILLINISLPAEFWLLKTKKMFPFWAGESIVECNWEFRTY